MFHEFNTLCSLSFPGLLEDAVDELQTATIAFEEAVKDNKSK